MFFGNLTIAINGFSMVFLFFYHRFQWFSMVPDHWWNDAMVLMDRRGLEDGIVLLAAVVPKPFADDPNKNVGTLLICCREWPTTVALG